MLISYKRGQGSIILRVKIADSTSTSNGGLTGLTSASGSLKIATIADNEATATTYSGSNLETITTLGTYAAPTSGKARFKLVDDTNLPGVYEIHLADARYAVSNSKYLIVTISGATNMVQTDVIIPLVQDDPYVAKPTNFNLLSIDSDGRVDVGAIRGSATAAVGLSAMGQYYDTETTLNVFVEGITAGVVTTIQTGLSTLTAQQVWEYGSRALTDKAGFTISGTITTLDALNTSLSSAHGSGSWATATGFSTHSAADVWAVATRTLTANTNLNILTAADIRTAVGLASANLDTQLSAIVADTNELQLDWVNGGRLDLILDASAASASTAATNAINANTNTNTIITNLATVDGIVDDIKAVTVKLDTMLVLDGVVYQYTANALELAASVDGVGDADQATLLLVKQQTDKITTSQLNVMSAIARYAITIKQGDSYIAANGDEATLTIPKPEGSTRYPDDLTAWTVTLKARSHPDNTASGTGTISEVMTKVNPTTTQDLQITSLTAVETAALKTGQWLFDIVAVNGSDTRTLISGTMKVDATNA